MRKRHGVVRKGAATVALALFVVAQPQVMCALHCLVLDHMGDMDGAAMARMPVHGMAPSGSSSDVLTAQEHHPVAMPCGHGMNTITAPTLPVAAMGFATVTVVQHPVFGIRPSVSAFPGSATVVMAYTPRVDTPPPRA